MIALFSIVSKGRQYDKNGNLVDWWTPESVEAFKNRAQCVIDQYGGYVMPENNMTVSKALISNSEQ